MMQCTQACVYCIVSSLCLVSGLGRGRVRARMEASWNDTTITWHVQITCIVLSFIANLELGGRARETEKKTEMERAMVQVIEGQE